MDTKFVLTNPPPVPSQEEEEVTEESFGTVEFIAVVLIVIGALAFVFFSGKWYGESRLLNPSNYSRTK